ncbi:ATP synthase F(1) complex subunit epsilon, mitochondrial-like [Acropora palmata]|uniref:ATP synthase F(1) complex subunit epsilon, mitochondrial-like n=1 Tax=Acropora palmata TaxID=6131 RepID=UPI003DA0523D
MVSYWRQAGLSYLNFSTICARLVRRCLKPELRVEALKREESLMKTVKWEGGKQVSEAKSISQGF